MSKRRVILFVIFLIAAMPPLFNSLSNPRLEGLHGSDRLQLIAVGLLFGCAFGVLFGGRKFPGE
jgi:hypothetical protein